MFLSHLCLFRTELLSNYIKVEFEEDKGIYQYIVVFDPPIDSKSAKFHLLNQHKEKFPAKTFDGTSLYIPTMLEKDVIIIL